MDTSYLKIVVPIAMLIIVATFSYYLTRNDFAALESRRIRMECQYTDLPCIAAQLSDIILKNGTGEAFRIVARMYEEEPDLRKNCGSLTSFIGTEIVKKEPRYRFLKLEPGSIFCNYGFYQSYAREFLLATKDLDRARDLCAYVSEKLDNISSGASVECYRGIGQALPFIDNSIQGNAFKMTTYAVQTCKKIGPEAKDVNVCMSGAFNRIGEAERESTHGLTVNTRDPFDLCHHQPEESRDFCYGNFKRAIISSSVVYGDLEKAIEEFKKKYPSGLTIDDLKSIAFTIGYDNTTRSLGNLEYDALVTQCTNPDRELMQQCIYGTALSLAKTGTPGKQYLQVEKFCDTVRALESTPADTSCPGENVLSYMKGFYTSKVFAGICKSLKIDSEICATP